MDKIVVKDFNSALEACIASWGSDFSWENVELSKDAMLTVKLEGSQWDGKLDYRIAEFVIKLQKSFIAAYNDQSEHKIKYNTLSMDKAGLRVIVSVEPGCSWLKAFFTGMWDNMESSDKRNTIIAVALICAVTGGIVYWHKTNTEAETSRISEEHALQKFREQTKAEIEKKVQEGIREESARKEAIHAIDRAFELVEQTAAPVAFLARKMQKEDHMTIGNVRIPADTSMRLFRPVVTVEEVMEEHSYILDGDYVVTAIDREKDLATIRFDDKKRNFSLSWLEGSDLEDFYKYCASHKSDNLLLPIPLHLKATFAGGVFKGGIVQGTGPKREGAKTFSEAALDSASRQEDEDQTQNQHE